MPPSENFGQQFQSGVFSNKYSSMRLSPGRHGLYMHNFVTNVEHRGEGHGTRLMHDVVAYADRTGQDIYAHARPELHDFYGRFGFETTGREAEDISNPDADLLPEIHRPAKR